MLQLVKKEVKVMNLQDFKGFKIKKAIHALQKRFELAESDDESLADSRRFALKGGGLHLLAGAGACEAAAFVSLPFFASLLPGSLLPVMSQGLLIFSMIFSAVILGRRYDLLQASKPVLADLDGVRPLFWLK